MTNQKQLTDIADRVTKIIVEHFGIDESKVKPDSSLYDDLGADSLDTIELIMAFEDEFECVIADDVAEKLRTVQDAINMVESSFPA